MVNVGPNVNRYDTMFLATTKRDFKICTSISFLSLLRTSWETNTYLVRRNLRHRFRRKTIYQRIFLSAQTVCVTLVNIGKFRKVSDKLLVLQITYAQYKLRLALVFHQHSNFRKPGISCISNPNASNSEASRHCTNYFILSFSFNRFSHAVFSDWVAFFVSHNHLCQCQLDLSP